MGKARTADRRQSEVEAMEVARLLGRTMRGLKANWAQSSPLDDVFAGTSLGPRHFPVLIETSLQGGLSVSELAERVGLSLPATSLLVNELSREGFVERREDDRDRRRTLVFLHSDYSEMLDAWRGRAMTPVRQALEQLSPGQRESFVAGLQALAAASEPGGGDSPEC